MTLLTKSKEFLKKLKLKRHIDHNENIMTKISHAYDYHLCMMQITKVTVLLVYIVDESTYLYKTLWRGKDIHWMQVTEDHLKVVEELPDDLQLDNFVMADVYLTDLFHDVIRMYSSSIKKK